MDIHRNHTREREDHSFAPIELRPTPNTSTIVRTDQNNSFMVSHLVQSSPTSTVQEPDISISPSLEWDDVGTDLIQSTDPSYLESLYDFPLDEVRNLNNLLPIPYSMQSPIAPDNRPRPNLHEAARLDFHLPISSTPCLQRRQIITTPRPLPEPGRRITFFSSFLVRLNPFKKRQQK